MRLLSGVLSLLPAVALALVCPRVEAQTGGHPVLHYSQPIGKLSQPIGKLQVRPLVPLPLPPLPITLPDGLGLVSDSPGLLISEIILTTDYPDPILVETQSDLPAFPNGWATSAKFILPGKEFVLSWQPESALLGEQIGLDTNGAPVFAEASLFIDPATIPDMDVFLQSTFTLRAVAVPESGSVGLLASAVALSGLLALRRKRHG